MRLASYKAADGTLRAGLVTDGGIVDLECAGQRLGLDLPSDLLAILSRPRS